MILITGGLGYIGGRLAHALALSPPALPVRLLSRRSPSQYPTWAQSLSLMQGDVLDPSTLARALEGVETVIHLASVNEHDAKRDPELALAVNGKGTYLLLKAAQQAGVQRFIFFSTFHVYGPWAPPVITEEAPTRPVHPYAITHRLAEDFVNEFRHSSGLQTLIVRLSNGYGFPMDLAVNRWTLIFNDLCKQAIHNGKVVLRTSGKQQRDFISLTDVSRAVAHFLNGAPGSWADGLFNLGRGSSLSILAVARRIAEVYSQRYGKPLAIETTPVEDPTGTKPFTFNVDKLARTGFSFLDNMDEEIAGTLHLLEQGVVAYR